MERIVLIGNYPPDKQESMERFARMLDSDFYKAGVYSEIWRPKVVFGKFAKSTIAGVGKWLGYIDKYIVFPVILIRRLQRKNMKTADIRFHVCDHSNAPYLKYLPSGKKGITCHDVLAIRGALGYADAACPASFFGKILQKWILNNLRKAKILAAVSQYTMDQLKEITTDKVTDETNWRVIHNAFNAEFSPMNGNAVRHILSKAGLGIKVPFLLHVGSALPRKNRKMLIDMVLALGDLWQGVICFAGEEADADLLAHIAQASLQKRVIWVIKPDHETLVALYSSCEAFVFPSLSEGFGWPLIEAQACGAPVIASDIDPMPEVCGGAALHVSPHNPQAFAAAFMSLSDDNFRAGLVKRGFENSRRFSPVNMIEAYLDMYGIGDSNKKYAS